jgi:hypothetical protein
MRITYKCSKCGKEYDDAETCLEQETECGEIEKLAADLQETIRKIAAKGVEILVGQYESLRISQDATADYDCHHRAVCLKNSSIEVLL